MTIEGMDSIVKGDVSTTSRSRRPPSEGSKLHRANSFDGFTICASGTPSIPSRYLTIISSNSEKRGFQQTAKRFQYELNGCPGPGQYQVVQSIDKQLEKTSDSKKGSGGFASKSKRQNFTHGLASAPSPTSYNTAGRFGSTHRDFNRKCSSMFQQPIAERPVSPKQTIPAPNQYDVHQGLKSITKANNVTAQAAFRSHTRRSVGLGKHLLTPAPGAYNLDDSGIRALPINHQSSFKSTSKRDAFGNQSAVELPGPADYHPFEALKEEPHRQLLPRRHYLAISAPAIPPAPEAPFPGPGAYELRDFKEVEKKYMSSAAFVSSTSRWATDAALAMDQPGPGSYTPHAPDILKMSREELLELMKQKEDIEKELNELAADLQSQNNVGMTEKLVDQEGYPRNDIDLVRVRQARQRVICLQNDHKALMKKIEDGLFQIHETVATSPPSTTTTTTTATTTLSNKEPFLRIDIVSAQSPAEAAGLHVGDLVCRIGTIRKVNFRTMQDVASLVTNSENRSITLLVQRANTKHQETLSLTPKKWSGAGLLGCKLTPLS